MSDTRASRVVGRLGARTGRECRSERTGVSFLFKRLRRIVDIRVRRKITGLRGGGDRQPIGTALDPSNSRARSACSSTSR